MSGLGGEPLLIKSAKPSYPVLSTSRLSGLRLPLGWYWQAMERPGMFVLLGQGLRLAGSMVCEMAYKGDSDPDLVLCTRTWEKVCVWLGQMF